MDAAEVNRQIVKWKLLRVVSSLFRHHKTHDSLERKVEKNRSNSATTNAKVSLTLRCITNIKTMDGNCRKQFCDMCLFITLPVRLLQYKMFRIPVQFY